MKTLLLTALLISIAITYQARALEDSNTTDSPDQITRALHKAQRDLALCKQHTPANAPVVQPTTASALLATHMLSEKTVEVIITQIKREKSIVDESFLRGHWDAITSSAERIDCIEDIRDISEQWRTQASSTETDIRKNMSTSRTKLTSIKELIHKHIEAERKKQTRDERLNNVLDQIACRKLEELKQQHPDHNVTVHLSHPPLPTTPASPETIACLKMLQSEVDTMLSMLNAAEKLIPNSQ